MRRLVLSSVLSLGLLSAIAPAAFAASTNLDQSGNYTLTMVRQDGSRTMTRSYALSEARFQQLSTNLATRAASGKGLVGPGMGVNRSCSAAPGSNTASVNQTGNANLAAAQQIGSGNTAGFAQNGNANIAYTIQLGQNHEAQTTQSGNNNIGILVQNCR